MSPKKEPDVKEGEANNGADESYSVEKILATRIKGGRREYLIKWEGYSYEEATWEAEADCDCPDAIAEFKRIKPNRARAGKDEGAVIGEQAKDLKQSKGARRATLSETKGIEGAKRTRRRTNSIQVESTSKKPKVASEELKKDSDTPTTPNGVRSRRSLENASNSGAKRRSLKDRMKTELSERAGSYESDDASVRNRFLNPKKMKEDVKGSKGSNESSRTDRVYKLQQGKQIEAILGVNRDGSHLLYAVQYKGPEPKHQRIELVPSSVLRSHAIEEFVDFLEQLVVANTAHVDV